MRTELLRRGARAAAVATLACVTTLSTAGVAPATAQPQWPSPAEVTIGASGIQAPRQHPGGLVAFRVRTDDPKGRQLQLLRPRRDVRLDRVLRDLRRAVSHDRRTAAAGIRAVTAEADALGGALVTPRAPAYFAERIAPGRVFLLDFTQLLAHPTVTPRVRALDLRGRSDSVIPRFPHATVIQQETSAGPRFRVAGLRGARGAFLVHNASREPREMRISPVGRGTTDAGIQAYFNALARGGNPPTPFTGPSTGLGAISPGRTAVVRTDLGPGRYVLLCFVPDDKRGVPHAVLGMHQVITLD